MAELQASIEQAARWVCEAPAILITAGAGMNVDSDVAELQGRQGAGHGAPMRGETGGGWHGQEVASPRAFHDQAELAWSAYGCRLQAYRSTAPHAGFGMLLKWGQRVPFGCRVFTSNVDGHFQAAGFQPAHVAECHGSLHYFQCAHPLCKSGSWPADGFQPRCATLGDRRPATLPRCPLCGSLARPNILLSDDPWWNDDPYRQTMQHLREWCARQARHLLVIEIGAGQAVPTVRRFGQRHAHRLIRINPCAAEVPKGAQALGLAASAREALSRIDDLIA